MSEDQIEFRVPVTQIKEIYPHPNPKVERLEIVKVFDFNVVVRKGQYRISQTVIFVPIDSILPNNLETQIFGPDSKIKLTKGRIRQIRIQQFASQGMIISTEDIRALHPNLGMLEEGQNLAEILGITKYDPPAPDYQANNTPRAKKERNRSYENPYLHEYNGCENFKWYPDVFTEGQEVVYQEKIHGTNGRAGILPTVVKTRWQKLLKFLKLLPEYQFCYGSNKVQLQSKSYTGFYDDNVYAEACKKYDIKNKLKPHETVYFEIYGDKVQKDYMYDCKGHERRIVIFDVKVLASDYKSTRFLTTSELAQWCEDRQLPLVPYLYQGAHTKELAKQYTKGRSVLAPQQEIREGIVIKDPKETVSFFGKKYLKYLNEDYLDLDNTDFH